MTPTIICIFRSKSKSLRIRAFLRAVLFTLYHYARDTSKLSKFAVAVVGRRLQQSRWTCICTSCAVRWVTAAAVHQRRSASFLSITRRYYANPATFVAEEYISSSKTYESKSGGTRRRVYKRALSSLFGLPIPARMHIVRIYTSRGALTFLRLLGQGERPWPYIMRIIYTAAAFAFVRSSHTASLRHRRQSYNNIYNRISIFLAARRHYCATI